MLNTWVYQLTSRLLRQVNLQVIYYPPAGYIDNSPNPVFEGRRRLAFKAKGIDPDFDGNLCAAVPGAEAYVYRTVEDTSSMWISLCDDFYKYPRSVAKNVPESANDLDDFKNQASMLLHERKQTINV
jgi:hypothetical protein